MCSYEAIYICRRFTLIIQDKEDNITFCRMLYENGKGRGLMSGDQMRIKSFRFWDQLSTYCFIAFVIIVTLDLYSPWLGSIFFSLMSIITALTIYFGRKSVDYQYSLTFIGRKSTIDIVSLGIYILLVIMNIAIL
jgi:hypothetical protein